MAPGRAAPTLGQHPDGAEVVLGFDGSFLGDCTALLAVTVADRPHVHLVKLWEAPEGSREWRVPLVEVEHAIRAACARWRPRGRRRPSRWQRSLELLDAEGIAVSEFPRHLPGWARRPPGSTPPSSTGC